MSKNFSYFRPEDFKSSEATAIGIRFLKKIRNKTKPIFEPVNQHSGTQYVSKVE